MTYVAHFADGSTSPVESIAWSPEFLTGLATRGDGFKRAVFFGQHDGGQITPDPWINRVTRLTASGVTREEK